jgi:hypothetical protein
MRTKLAGLRGKPTTTRTLAKTSSQRKDHHFQRSSTMQTNTVHPWEKAKAEEQARQAQADAAKAKREAEEQARRRDLVLKEQMDARARAVPDALFADDPEIMALRADHEAKQRQMTIVSLASPTLVFNTMERLKQRIKAGAFEAALAAVEDVEAGDDLLPRAMAFQRQVDDDARRLDVLTRVQERLGKHGFAAVAREREQGAREALEGALMDRKRQHLRNRAADAAPAGDDDQLAAADDAIEL